MKPFRFSLQRVLDVKTLMEKQQRLRVAEANRDALAARESLARVEALRVAAVAEGNDATFAVEPALRAISWRRRARLLQQVSEERNRTEAAERRLADERHTLVERHKERRSLELLSTGQQNRHREEQTRRQQNVVDDLFIGRIARESGRETRE